MPILQTPTPSEAPQACSSLRNRDFVEQLFADVIQRLRGADPQERIYLVRAIQCAAGTLASVIEPIQTLQSSTEPLPASVELSGQSLIPTRNLPAQATSFDASGSESNGTASTRQSKSAYERRKRKDAKRSQRRSQRATPDASVELFPVRVALSATAGIKEVIHSRDTFFHEISALRVKVKTDNRVSVSSFTTAEATAITNFFFAEVMGASSRQRLTLLLNYYSCHSDNSIDIGAGARADQLAEDPEAIPLLREFYISFSQAHRQKLNSNTNYAYFVQTVASLKLYHEWTRLRELAAAKDPALLAILRASGLKASRGVDYRSLVNQFLTTKLGLESPVHLQNMCQSAQGIACLVQQFGHGVLVFLPPGAGNKLLRWGAQRMAAVIPILGNCVEAFAPICAIAEKEIYTPMMEGTKLRIAGPFTTRASLEEMFNIRVIEELPDCDTDS